MIDRETAFVGMKVIRNRDGYQMTIEQILTGDPWPYRCRGLGGESLGRFKYDELDPAEPENPLKWGDNQCENCNCEMHPKDPSRICANCRKGTAPTAETKRERNFQRFDVNDTIRMPHYDTVGKGSYRVWQIIGVHLGATHQEGTYALKPLDIEPNEPIHVPCLMLETHPEVEKL